jgi:hypothetical protein
MTRVFLPSDFDQFYIDGRFGFYGLKAIKLALNSSQLKSYDWIIFLDEDAAILDSKRFLELINYMRDEKIAVAGVRDGGEIEFRRGNPHFPNLSFCAISRKLLPMGIDYSPKLSSDFFTNKENFDEIVMLNPNHVTYKNSEEYYNFFNELKIKNSKFLFLPARYYNQSEDEFTTVFLDHKGTDLVIHAWWARAYGKNKIHTDRIDQVLKSLILKRNQYQGKEILNPEHISYLLKFRKKQLKKLVKKLLFIER